jgi:hypothetical protein
MIELKSQYEEEMMKNRDLAEQVKALEDER